MLNCSLCATQHRKRCLFQVHIMMRVYNIFNKVVNFLPFMCSPPPQSLSPTHRHTLSAYCFSYLFIKSLRAHYGYWQNQILIKLIMWCANGAERAQHHSNCGLISNAQVLSYAVLCRIIYFFLLYCNVKKQMYCLPSFIIVYGQSTLESSSRAIVSSKRGSIY